MENTLGSYADEKSFSGTGNLLLLGKMMDREILTHFKLTFVLRWLHWLWLFWTSFLSFHPQEYDRFPCKIARIYASFSSWNRALPPRNVWNYVFLFVLFIFLFLVCYLLRTELSIKHRHLTVKKDAWIFLYLDY